jgi:DNA-binding CsgD family transcriptional regulator/HD-like signal output (HDOD) protein
MSSPALALQQLPAPEPVPERMGGRLAACPGRARPATAGQRLIAAFEEVETFPALRKSRDAMVKAGREGTAGRRVLIGVIESDPALVIAVLRAAGRHAAGGRPVAVTDAVAALSSAEIEAVAARVPVFDFFEQSRPWSDTAEQFRVHARATQTATAYVRRALGFGPRPDLRAAALLHDIGKLVLLRAYDRYEPIWNMRAPPDERVTMEQTELGIDHALVGGVLARRLGLAGPLARTIELHHKRDVMGDAAIIRLADMLAHYASGGAVQGGALSAAARTVGLSTEDLRGALDELPGGARVEARGTTPSPLTARETEMVQQLAVGKVYKQIAADAGLQVTTVRTHLSNTYRKLGVVDRAQAVLLATDNGWL